jgi:hypothetical protein
VRPGPSLAEDGTAQKSEWREEADVPRLEKRREVRSKVSDAPAEIASLFHASQNFLDFRRELYSHGHVYHLG